MSRSVANPAANNIPMNMFLAIACPNHHCQERIYLMRLAERYSNEKPDLPRSFHVVCPKCNERHMVQRSATYFITLKNSTAVRMAEVL